MSNNRLHARMTKIAFTLHDGSMEEKPEFVQSVFRSVGS